VRRIALILVALVAAGTFVVLAAGAGSGSSGSTYYAELDNAFGLVKGGDMKVAGVRAGKITDLILCTTNEKKCPAADRGSNRALVGFSITQNGFGSMRTDTFCQSRPQSLIGEYYIDCQPGSARQVLKGGSTIPVSRTASTISPDLLGDVLRDPYRQRLSIILGELGAAAAGNGQNLNDAIRRAVPALRETDNVLAILAKQNHILADLATQGDIVLHDLAGNRRDVQRWITASRGAAVDSAARKAAIEAGFAKLPGFLEQLRPAMAALGQVADTNTPALRNLNASAGQLKLLFNNLGPFATASTPSFAALGKASVTGDQAAKAATGTVQQLNAFALGTPELAQNLSIILQHLDDPQFGLTRDPRAVAQHPLTHSNTYTGLESLLQYVFDQTADTNYFTADGHLLGLSVFSSPTCDPYADAAAARAELKTHPECHTWLGPTQPGITTPDPTKMVTPAAAPAAHRNGAPQQAASAPAAPNTGAGSGAGTGSSGAGGGSGSSGGSSGTCLVGVCVPTPQTPSVPNVPSTVGQGVSGAVGTAQQQTQQATGATGASGASGSGSGGLLNYLLGP
jgi:ABC-type transporter Mla subunit MlaD